MGNGGEPIGPDGHLFPGVVVGRANVARIYDCWLGGKDHLAVDREVAARVAAAQPLVVTGVRANRAFLRRAVAYLAGLGIDQFLDLGSGLPTGQNVHEVAGRVNPHARTVYVDNDAVVLVHARALLAVNDRTIVVEGDVRDPGAILASPEVRGHLDFSRPVAVVMVAVLHFVTDAEDPNRIVAAFREVMAPGSGLVVTHLVQDADSEREAATRRGARIYSESATPIMVRTREQVAAWLEGLTLVAPGLVNVDQWRRTGRRAASAPMAGAVGLLDATGCRATVDPGPGARSRRYRSCRTAAAHPSRGVVDDRRECPTRS